MQHVGLVDAVDHLLNRGAVIVGKSTISLASVDLIHLELKLLLSSVETLRQGGRLSPLWDGGEVRAISPPSLRQGDHPSTGGSKQRPYRAGSGSPLQVKVTGESVSTSNGLISTGVGIPTPRGLLFEREVPHSHPLPEEGWGDNPDERPERGLARLVLTLAELLRQLVERQAVRRMAGGGLSEEQVEAMGLALRELEIKMAEIREIFGLSQEEIQLDLGPLGRLL